VLAVAAQARRAACGADGTPARSRARTVTGQWVVLHGTRLGDTPGAPTAVIIEPARSAELAELIVLAYGFTPRERQVTLLVVLGLSTAEIAQQLHLSPFTVQDYLKNIFDKFGVRTRRELVATVFRDHYWPRVLASETTDAGGFFGTPRTTPDPHC
jgi:DNA-binding CsgD family transcriptional regulator